MTDPLVVTLALDAASQDRLDGERRQWFPAARNHLGAHVTLFHALPGDHVDEVRDALSAAAAATPAFDAAFTGVRPLGRGVAYDLRADRLPGLHEQLRQRFRPWLTRQDQQRLSAHVTIANKLDPADARQLFQRLTAAFTPWTATATGLSLWWYRGGPWEAVRTLPFSLPA